MNGVIKDEETTNKWVYFDKSKLFLWEFCLCNITLKSKNWRRVVSVRITCKGTWQKATTWTRFRVHVDAYDQDTLTEKGFTF